MYGQANIKHITISFQTWDLSFYKLKYNVVWKLYNAYIIINNKWNTIMLAIRYKILWTEVYIYNGRRSLKLWQLLLTYWLPNTHWNWQGYVVSVMFIAVRNIKLTCEWHKAIKLNYKNTLTRVIVVLRLPSTLPQAAVDCSALAKVTALVCLVPGRRIGQVWHYERLTVRRHPRSPHISMAIIPVTVQLWI